MSWRSLMAARLCAPLSSRLTEDHLTAFLAFARPLPLRWSGRDPRDGRAVDRLLQALVCARWLHGRLPRFCQVWAPHSAAASGSGARLLLLTFVGPGARDDGLPRALAISRGPSSWPLAPNPTDRLVRTILLERGSHGSPRSARFRLPNSLGRDGPDERRLPWYAHASRGPSRQGLLT